MDRGSEAEAVVEVIAVGVPGGTIAVEHVTAGTGRRGPVLAVPGISSQRKLWNWLRAERPDLSLIAPDLRGRGDSAGVTGPSSVARHAADLVAVLDHLGLDAVPVCGMSMGGFGGSGGGGAGGCGGGGGGASPAGASPPPPPRPGGAAGSWPRGASPWP